MPKQVIADISRCVGSSMSIVYTHEGPKRTWLDLALVFENLVCLDHGHREITWAILSDIPEPEQAVFAFSSTGPTTKIATNSSNGIESASTTPEWLPTEREQIHQCLKHPTSLRNPIPNTQNRNLAKVSPSLFFCQRCYSVWNLGEEREGWKREIWRRRREEGCAERRIGRRRRLARRDAGCVRW